VCVCVCVCVSTRACVLVCVWNADKIAPARVETQELTHAHTIWRHHEREYDVDVGHFDDVREGHE
jgi:hypothetical protein